MDDSHEADKPPEGPLLPALNLKQYRYQTTTTLRRSPRNTPEHKPTPSITTKSPNRITKPSKPPPHYAPPSRYAHLPQVPDILAPNLLLLLVGLNPGVSTALAGHAYAHPSNGFWRTLHAAGLTPDRRLAPAEDATLPARYALGLTNIVARPTKDQSQLGRAEMVAGARVLEEKCARWRPEAVCLVGKGIWEAVWRWRYGRALRREEFRWGWQEEGENMGRVEEGEEAWGGARVFVATSTSGLAASLGPAEKEAVWRPLGEWVQARRVEREAGRGGDGGVCS